MTRNTNESIAYPEGLRAGALLPAAVLWVLLGFGGILLPLLYFLRLRPQHPPLLPLPLPQWGLADAYFLLAALGAFGLLFALVLALRWYVEQMGEAESETRRVLLEMSDGTSLGAWERTLIVWVPILAVILLVMGWAGPLEAILVAGAAAGAALGTRLLPRFPEPPQEHRIPFDDAEIERLFAGKEGAAASAEYRWRFREHPYLANGPEKEFSFSIPFDTSHYDAARVRPHDVQAGADYARFVREDLTCAEVVIVAAKLRELHEERRYTRFQQVGNVLAFARQFRYAHDDATRGIREYPRYPIETLWDREGDCEDFAILSAALLDLLGLDVVLLILDFAEDPGHAALGVAGAEDMPRDLHFYHYRGRRYYYCEPTPPGDAADPARWEWSIGQTPFEDPSRVTVVSLADAVSAP